MQRKHLSVVVWVKSKALCTGEDTSCSNVAIRASVRKSILCFKGLLTSNNSRVEGL